MVITRDESKLHNIPDFWPMVMFINLIGMLFAGIYSVVALIKQDYTSLYIGLGLFITLFILGKFGDIYFNWYINYTYDLSNTNRIKITYRLNGYAMGDKSKAEIHIKSVSKYKIKQSKVIVYGEIEKKLPMRDWKQLNKIEIQYDFCTKDREKIIEALDKIKK